ncbi:histidine phosphatase family protein [Candidatus Nomurabacteria bacterium]|uniref:phosphoglycerate mutase (2,3-diphosphoglycerate-dependent) n=1 Tax=candidate division WWE3 bacterium TaxID=2053526 RepID=A0A955E1R4_UNCKA|nr:histidine phosphatase family protein [candidate division WWE3 bacterium]MCB9824109.1 histidine phosphatase family protein [Candidatus Nomurabacteria bacterium]MCB9826920.1 histidine phosphatase family protein [Candidatus Nomurabacteria bacterium]MCB9828050.1 histidine phosphatase family protein [Candidatus Nomurabacteria bacterium]
MSVTAPQTMSLVSHDQNLTPKQKTEDLMLELIENFGKDEVEEAVKYLHYRNPTPLPKNEKKGKPILYVFRHGETSDNFNMLFSGWRDVNITEKGKKQALALANKLAKKDIDMLICSDQIRSIETMKLAMSKNTKGKNLEIIKEPRIKERRYGDWEGQSKLKMLLTHPESKEQRRDFDFVPPNGESMAMVEGRVLAFLREILPLMRKHNVNVALSCHGNSIRAIRKKYEGLTNEQAAHIETILGEDYAAYYVG